MSGQEILTEDESTKYYCQCKDAFVSTDTYLFIFPDVKFLKRDLKWLCLKKLL